MRQPKPELALRYRGGDRHHLFLNHGTWFLRYSVREAPWLKADRRVCVSLKTKDFSRAKERRDVFLSHLQFHAAVTADPKLDFRDDPKPRATNTVRSTTGDQLGFVRCEGRAA